MTNGRVPTAAKWAYMRELGRGRYILSCVWHAAATYVLVVTIIAWVVPPHSGVVEFILNWIRASTLLFAVLSGFRAWYQWKQAEAGDVLRSPTIHTPRFEGTLPSASPRRPKSP